MVDDTQLENGQIDVTQNVYNLFRLWGKATVNYIQVGAYVWHEKLAETLRPCLP